MAEYNKMERMVTVPGEYNEMEMMIAVAARELENGSTVGVGTGAPCTTTLQLSMRPVRGVLLVLARA